jgi:hypothetical protein
MFIADKDTPDHFEELIEHTIEHASRKTAIALLSRAIPELLREAVSSKVRETIPDVICLMEISQLQPVHADLWAM